MIGFLLNENLATDAAIKEALDRFSLTPVDQVRTLLHWKLYAFRDRDRFDLARLMLTFSGLIPLEVSDRERDFLRPRIALGDTLTRLVRAMSTTKPDDLSLEEAEAMKRGYAMLVAANVLPAPNARSHQAWVTMRWEKSQEAAGAWTHDVAVAIDIAGDREVVRQRAVSREQAERKAARLRRDQRLRLGVDRRYPATTTIRQIDKAEAA